MKSALRALHSLTGEAMDNFPAALLPLLEISDEAQRIELTKELIDFIAKAFAAHNRRVDEKLLSEAIKPILEHIYICC